MDTLILLSIVVAAFLIVNFLSGKISEVNSRFAELSEELQKIRMELERFRQPENRPKSPDLRPFIPKPEASLSQSPPIIPETQPVIPQLSESVKTVGETTEKATETVGNAAQKVTPQPELVYQFVPPVYEEPEPGFFARFMQNNPDLEKFIGENLINKIGIAILVLGIGYFVKFAIDKDWINEIGRVFIGILAGGLLIGIAHRLRTSFTSFSSVLVGGGLAVLYFTIAIAFHEYHIFSQTAAFLIMAVITGFSVLLSVSYNRVELAVLAILGGFATPFMVSTGQGNYQVLFTYILLLNTGMLVLAYLKNWRLLNWICYGFTVLLFGGWLTTRVLGQPNAPYLGALIFATLFYTVFFLMNIINNVKEKSHFVASEIGILLSNTFLYYAAGMAILHYVQAGMYQGLFTAAVAVFNFIFAFLLFRRQQVDRNLVYLLIGLVITFISLAIPVQLEGNYITMFWALEAVLLLWFAQKTGIKLAVISSVVVMGLMLISLLMDWSAVYVNYPAGTAYNILLNKGFITGVIAIISLAVTSWLLRRENNPVPFRLLTFEPLVYRRIISFVLIAIIYLVLFFELNYQLNVYLNPGLNKTVILGCFNLAYIGAILILARYKKQPGFTLLATLLGLFGIFIFAVYYTPTVNKLIESHFLYNDPEFVGFGFHYMALTLFGLLVYFTYRYRAILEAYWPAAGKYLLWNLSLVVVYVASAELLYHVLYFNLPLQNTAGLPAQHFNSELHQYFYELKQQTFKVGFAILWGICAFILMFTGLRKKNKHLRIIALTLFTITLLKLFLFDIRGISEGGKIAAFIFLGVLLLIISFMYQNIKKLLLSDEVNADREENL